MAQTKPAEDLEKDLKIFREWVDTQPQLPNDIGDNLLIRFLHSCYYDMEKAKAALLNFCSLRLTAPELFTNRDPLSKQMKDNLSIVKLAQLQISGDRNLWIWQLNDPGLEKYDYVQDARLFFLTTDSWLLSASGLEAGDVAILDVKDISLRFLTKFNVGVARKLSKYQEEAMPIRLKEIHLINAPPFIDKIYGLLKPFMRQDYCDMMHFHAPKSDTLFKYFDKGELPDDFGGAAGSLDDHTEKVIQEIEKNREHFLNENLWKMIEVKKSKGNKAENSTDVGSFRSLAID